MRINSIRQFDKPWSTEAKYWLGFLLADGCITEKGILGIGLQTKDVNHLEKFSNFLEVKSHIYYHKNKKCVQFQIGAKSCFKELKSYGIVPRKSLIAKPILGLEEDVDFWRGVIDGDGSIFIRDILGYITPVIKIFGTNDIVKGFVDFIYKLTPNKKLPKIYPQVNIFQFSIKGHRARYIISKLYYPGCVALDRKMEIANKVKELVINEYRRYGAERS